MVMAYALWSSYNLCLVLLKYMVTRYYVFILLEVN
jgi:hypothetical protein